jgi:hypothetical protein
MLNDTTKPGEVLNKGGLDLLTLLHRRDVELHAHLGWEPSPGPIPKAFLAERTIE